MKFELLDLTKRRFGRLVAIKATSERSSSGSVIWECKCDCGQVKKVTSKCLLSSKTKSCGCTVRENGAKSLKEDNRFLLVENTCLLQLTKKIARNNTSGIKGVSWNKRDKKWEAKITFKHQIYRLGRFTNLEDAAKERRLAEEKYFTPILEKYGKGLQM